MLYLSNRRARYFKITINYLILISLILVYYTTAHSQKDLSTLVKKVSPSVVLINVFNKDGNLKGIGTGFFIKEDGILVTNYHVIEGGIRAEARLSSGEVLEIEKILSEDREGDLVLLTVGVRGRSFPTLKLSDTKIEAGQSVVVIGSPFGLEGTVSDGIISAVREIPAFDKIIQISAPVSKGSSGSPVLNMKGEVIGIATFQMIEGQGLNFAIPSKRIAILKPNKGQTLFDWEARRMEELLTSAKELYSAGLRFLWIEDYGKALSYFKEAVKKNPNDPKAHFQIGYCNGKLGRRQEGIEAYKQAIRIKQDFVDAHYNLGAAYNELGRFKEAVDSYKQAIRLDPNDAAAHGGLGGAYGNLGRYREAVEAYKQAILLDPNDAEAYSGLGAAYGFLGRLKEAIGAFQQAIQINPNDSNAHYNLGVAYKNLGRWRRAEEAYKEAIRIKPDYAEAHANLGEVYLKLGDRSSALKEYQILKNLDENLANTLFNLIYK